MGAPGESLEGESDPGTESDIDTPGSSSELDPQFAADAGAAFPDASDDQLMALQRAVMGLLGR
jgi:hypothetical protein